MRHGIFALAATLALSSCADWIEPKGLDVYVPTLESQNPELYAAYIQSLNDYKASDHKVMFVTFDNPTESLNYQWQRLNALPDSVDVASLTSPDNLLPAVVEDMKEVRKKGTKIVYDVNFPAIVRDWDLLVRENTALTEEDALAYIEERTLEALALCAKWGYDGITFTYIGQALGMPAAELAVYSARQTKFIGLVSTWRTANAGKAFSFIGNPQYLVEENRTILSQCDYIILSTELAKSENELTTTAQWAVRDGSPADRFVFRQYMYDVDDADKGNGYFNTRDEAGNRLYSIPITATWMNKPSDFVRHGMMIIGVQSDYFQTSPNWLITRSAIRTMNP